MHKETVLIFCSDYKLAFFKDFPVKHFLTTNFYGDFSFMNPDEFNQNRSLRNELESDYFIKIRAQHGERVIITASNEHNTYKECDAVVQYGDGSRRALIGNTGDCTMILLASEADNPRLVGLIHSGWKSAKKNIVAAASLEMQNLGARPEKIMAAVWPGICPDCYPAETVFHDSFLPYAKKGKLNLKRMIIDQLTASGIKPKNIFSVSSEKYCSSHSRFNGKYIWSSYKRDGNTERNAIAISS